MKLIRISLLCMFFSLMITSCAHDPISQPEATPATAAALNAELVAAEIMAACQWVYDSDAQVPKGLADQSSKDLDWLLEWTRELLLDDIAHYSFLVQIGPSEYDRIKIHRVVRETSPGRPMATPHTMFLQHGDAVGFVKFLYGVAAPSVPDEHSAAILLAQNDIDVWGIDQNWVMVPEDTAEFSFMQDWGIDNNVANLRLALGAARYTRYFSGDGFGKMPLLGYSSGTWLGMAYINDEAVMPLSDQHVGGFVLADGYYKVGPDNVIGQEVNCADAAAIAEELANGTYEWWVGFEEVGRYALDDPDGDSPIFEGFTNEQVGLYFGCAGFRDYPLNEWWHYWGGEFDGDPQDPTVMPIDTRFLPKEWAFEFMATASSWQAQPFFYDYCRISCDEEDIPWDDNLASITIPLLNLGGAGALAPSADYTLTLVGSTDIQEVIVQLLPDEQRFEDFGHIDMWTATDAPSLIWQPLADWAISHSGEDADQHPIGHSME